MMSAATGKKLLQVKVPAAAVERQPKVRKLLSHAGDTAAPEILGKKLLAVGEQPCPGKKLMAAGEQPCPGA